MQGHELHNPHCTNKNGTRDLNKYILGHPYHRQSYGDNVSEGRDFPAPPYFSQSNGTFDEAQKDANNYPALSSLYSFSVDSFDLNGFGREGRQSNPNIQAAPNVDVTRPHALQPTGIRYHGGMQLRDSAHQEPLNEQDLQRHRTTHQQHSDLLRLPPRGFPIPFPPTFPSHPPGGVQFNNVPNSQLLDTSAEGPTNLSSAISPVAVQGSINPEINFSLRRVDNQDWYPQQTHRRNAEETQRPGPYTAPSSMNNTRVRNVLLNPRHTPRAHGTSFKLVKPHVVPVDGFRMDNHFLEDRVSQHVTSPSSASSVSGYYISTGEASPNPHKPLHTRLASESSSPIANTFHEYRNNGKSPEGLEKPMWSLEDIAPRSPCQVPEVNPDPARACGGMSVRSDPPGADSIHERGTRERPGSFLTPVQSDTASGPIPNTGLSSALPGGLVQHLLESAFLASDPLLQDILQNLIFLHMTDMSLESSSASGLRNGLNYFLAFLTDCAHKT